MARTPAPKIVVLQRGGDRGHHETLARAAHFFLREQASARLVNTLSIRIELRASKLRDDVCGHVLLENTGSATQREFTIVVQRDHSIDQQLETIAHESVHVIQRATGRLQFRAWKTDSKVHARWDGADLGPREGIAYRSRPWEIEAFAAEAPLVRAFRASERRASAERRAG